jgi:hypothetical protein
MKTVPRQTEKDISGEGIPWSPEKAWNISGTGVGGKRVGRK